MTPPLFLQPLSLAVASASWLSSAGGLLSNTWSVAGDAARIGSQGFRDRLAAKDLGGHNNHDQDQNHDHHGNNLSSAAAANLAKRNTSKLFFLFLASDDVPTEDVWKRFFDKATAGEDYEALLHCVDSDACNRTIRHKSLFRKVRTVPSRWCDDVVSPMDELLSAAVGTDGGHDHDKFIFVSDTTVPVKPFEDVAKYLRADGSRSNFCIKGTQDWSWARGRRKVGSSMAVKHHQWMVLSRPHALQLVAKRHSDRDLVRNLVPMRFLSTTWLAPLLHFVTSPLPRPLPFVEGCLDEYLYFGQIFDFPVYKKNSASLRLPGLSGNEPLRLMPESSAQGRCDTFAAMGEEGGNFSSLLKALRDDDPETLSEESRFMGVQLRHPLRFARLSNTSLRALRDSPFLFARKVDRNTIFRGHMSIEEAFDKLIFSS